MCFYKRVCNSNNSGNVLHLAAGDELATGAELLKVAGGREGRVFEMLFVCSKLKLYIGWPKISFPTFPICKAYLSDTCHLVSIKALLQRWK